MHYVNKDLPKILQKGQESQITHKKYENLQKQITSSIALARFRR